MTKPLTGQYECLHSSGVGLDYFTSRIDRLILQQNGRFVFIIQDRSRIAHAAQSFVSGQQVNINAKETRREGTYSVHGNDLSLHFEDGAEEKAQLSWNGDGMQIGKDFFNKVSDSTVLPSAQRLKKDMDDIAKGLKIAGTIGGMAIKAAKTIHDTIQTTQESAPGQGQNAHVQGNVPQSATPPAQPVQQARPAPAQPQRVPTESAKQTPPQGTPSAVFCDQCGARIRAGKRFCNQCGAQLP